MVEAMTLPRYSPQELKIVASLFGANSERILPQVLNSGKSVNELLEMREKFGPGKSGEYAFTCIVLRIPCEAYVTDKESGMKKQCGINASVTVGFDARADYEIRGACTDDHAGLIENDIMVSVQEQIAYHGERNVHMPSFDRNGWGRS